MLSTKNFYFDSKKKTLSADISELAGMVYSNRFGVQSERTGKVVYFSIKVIHNDPDGDWTHATYKPETECGIKELIIFND